MLFSRNPRTSGDRNLSKKTYFFLIYPVFTGRFATLTYEKTLNYQRFPPNIVQILWYASFASYEPIWPEAIQQKTFFFCNISGVNWSICEFDIWKNAELQELSNEYSAKYILFVLCTLLADLTDFEFQKLL